MRAREAEDLTGYLFDRADAVGRSWIVDRATRSPRFLSFVHRYRQKIRKKLAAAASDDDRYDVVAELEAAYLLLKAFRCKLEYEKHGHGENRAPDLSMTLPSAAERHFEVKRIRDTPYERELNDWMRRLDEAIRGIPSRLAVSIDSHSVEEPFALLRSLQANRDAIVDYTQSMIRSRDGKVTTVEEHQVPNLGGRLSIRLFPRPGSEPPTDTAIAGHLFPIGFTQRESRKFGDAICEKLSQFRSGDANTLMVTTGNITHDGADLFEAIDSLQTREAVHDDAFFQQKRFANTGDFRAQFVNLSAVWFRSAYVGASRTRNTVWANPSAKAKLDRRAVHRLECVE